MRLRLRVRHDQGAARLLIVNDATLGSLAALKAAVADKLGLPLLDSNVDLSNRWARKDATNSDLLAQFWVLDQAADELGAGNVEGIALLHRIAACDADANGTISDEELNAFEADGGND